MWKIFHLLSRLLKKLWCLERFFFFDDYMCSCVLFYFVKDVELLLNSIVGSLITKTSPRLNAFPSTLALPPRQIQTAEEEMPTLIEETRFQWEADDKSLSFSSLVSEQDICIHTHHRDPHHHYCLDPPKTSSFLEIILFHLKNVEKDDKIKASIQLASHAW